MADRYGIPYKGSKNLIAQWVVDQLPPAENFYDLFCGGCAVTHRAMEARKYTNYIINDIDADLPKLFIDAMRGKYANRKEWISAELFELLKDSDVYVRYLWSFGNNGRNYLHNPIREKVAQAQWAVMMSTTLEECKKNTLRLLDIISANIDATVKQLEKITSSNYQKALVDAGDSVEYIKKYLRDALAKSGKTQADINKYLGTQMAGHYFGNSQWALPTAEHYAKLQEILNLPIKYELLRFELDKLSNIKNAACLNSLISMQGLSRIEAVTRWRGLNSLMELSAQPAPQVFTGSYQNVAIKPNSVIYCDIPYCGTDGYTAETFDHAAFYDWAEAQEQPVFISEYWMPEERFQCIAQIEKSSTLCSGGGKKVVEKLFIPRNQKAIACGQLKMF